MWLREIYPWGKKSYWTTLPLVLICQKLLLGKSIVLEQCMVNNLFIQHLCGIWKMLLTLTCNATRCPKPSSERYISSFSLDPLSMTPFDNQFCTLFPRVGDNSGYCGEEFHEAPPQNSTFGLNEWNLPSGQMEFYFACKRSTQICTIQFLSKKPWILPFQIQSYQSQNLMKILDNVSPFITVHSYTYKLAGFTMVNAEHFTPIVLWKGKKFIYNGVGATNELRLKILKNSDFSDQKGSFLFYLLL